MGNAKARARQEANSACKLALTVDLEVLSQLCKLLVREGLTTPANHAKARLSASASDSAITQGIELGKRNSELRYAPVTRLREGLDLIERPYAVVVHVETAEDTVAEKGAGARL